jgi:hypothetical protein
MGDRVCAVPVTEAIGVATRHAPFRLLTTRLIKDDL